VRQKQADERLQKYSEQQVSSQFELKESLPEGDPRRLSNLEVERRSAKLIKDSEIDQQMEDLEFEELMTIITKANRRRCFCMKRQIGQEVIERVNEKLD
jgi:hypothetical protein